ERGAPYSPRVMLRLRLWAPGLLLTLQPLWLLVQAPPIPAWTWNLDRLNSDPPGLTKPWSLPSPDLAPQSPPALTAPPEPGGSDYTESPAPAQMLAGPQEFFKMLNPDSAPQLPPKQGAPAQTSVAPQSMKPYLAHQEAPHLPLEPPTEMEPSRLQQEGPAETLQSTEGVKPPVQQEAPSQPPESPQEVEPLSAQQETSAEPPEPDEIGEPSRVQQGAPTELPEPSKVEKPFPTEQETPVQSPEGPEEHEPSLTQQEAQTQSLEPPKAVIPQTSVHQEVSLQPPGRNQPHHSTLPNITMQPVDVELTLTPEHKKEVQSCPTQQEAPAQPPKPPQEVKPSSSQQGAPAQPPTTPQEVEPSPIQQEAPAQPPERPEEVEPSSVQQEAPAQPPKPSEGVKPSPGIQEAPAQPPKPLEEEVPVQPPKPSEEVEPSPGHQEAPSQPSNATEEVEASPTQQETPGLLPQSPEEVASSSVQQEVPAQSPMLPQEVRPSPAEQEAPAQTPEPPEEVEPSSVQQEAPALPPKPLEEAQAQPPKHSEDLPHVSVKPVDLQLTVTPEPTKEVQSCPTQHEVQDQPPETQVVTQPEGHHEVTVSPPGQGKTHHPMLAKVTAQPLDLELTVTPEHTIEAEHSTTRQKTTASPPNYSEVTIPHPDQFQTQHPNLTDSTVQPLDLELTLTPGPTTQVEHSTALQKTTAPSPTHHEVTVPPPGHDAVQHPNLSNVTVQPLDLELTISPEPEAEVEPSPTRQETPTQLPEPQLMVSPEPTMEVTHSTTLQKTTSPPKQDTVKPLDLELTKTTSPPKQVTATQQLLVPSENYTPERVHLTVQWEQNATNGTNICELCVCRDETLSCAGLRPEKRLHRVPVPEPNEYNGTFTVLNFQGNSISYIEENIWKAYRWTEKLILSENSLTELRKDSFEGLLSLQYYKRDLSCNKIQSIERRAFEPLPFLRFINLGCNLITELGFGTFQAWHGMQFLHTLVLNRNPLTTLEDSYLFKLPALKYLDMGTTQVSLTTVENILIMTLQLEKLILPSHMACCLCQFKSTIEVVCKTLKLHCDSECLINTTRCSESEMLHSPSVTSCKNYSVAQSIMSQVRPALGQWLDIYNFNHELVNFGEKRNMVSYLQKVGPYSLGLSGVAQVKPSSSLCLTGSTLPGENTARVSCSRIRRLCFGNLSTQKLFICKGMEDLSIKRKQGAKPFMENTTKARRPLRPLSKKVERLLKVRRQRKLGGISFNTEPSSSKERKAAVSSSLKQYSMGRPSTSPSSKAPPEVRILSKDLSYTFFVLEEANARVKNIKEAPKSVSHSRKNYIYHKSRSRVVHRRPKAKTSRRFRKVRKLMLRNRPPSSAVRSLINSPPREAFSSSGELSSPENPFQELFLFPEPSAKTTTVHNATMLDETTPEITAHKDPSTADSAVTADNVMAPVKQTIETQWEYHNMGPDLPSKPHGSSLPLLSSPGDQFETQLNQQLRSLIPNNDVRRLIAHVMRTLKLDCSEPQVQMACAKLISRTGLLMKLLSEQQEFKVSKADWDTDQWKTDNYINESTEVQSEQKEQESSELTKEVPGYGYNHKLILAISLTVVVMILIILFCLIEIYAHRATSEEDKEGSSRGFFRSLLHRRCTSESESQGGFFWRRKPFWLRDMYRPLNASQERNRAQELHDKDSSDENEIFNKDAREATEVTTEKGEPTETT
uniref:LRRC37A/B like protein 1 C-terminal domain-containing protein n=1 Tax=Loxodonta africana TaxID=9785 RepID=G5E7F9_LOXAF